MPRIRSIGRFWRLDSTGFIQNDAEPGKIPAPYGALVAEVCDAYREHLGDAVRGIYVRGTVARGMPLKGASDLDDFALVERDPATLDLSWVEAASKRLLSRHPYVTGVGFECLDPGELGDGEHFSELALQMVTQTACVWGENAIPELPVYRPGVLVANNDIRRIQPDIKEAQAELERDSSPQNTLYWARRIAKNVVRCGFSLTILKHPRFTRDLYPCYSSFAEAYPEREQEMRRAVEHALDPPSDAEEVAAFLAGLGAWMIEESDAWLERHNPSRELAPRLDAYPEEVRFSSV